MIVMLSTWGLKGKNEGTMMFMMKKVKMHYVFFFFFMKENIDSWDLDVN